MWLWNAYKLMSLYASGAYVQGKMVGLIKVRLFKIIFDSNDFTVTTPSIPYSLP